MGEWRYDIRISECLNIMYGKDKKLVEDNDRGVFPILGTGGIMGYAKRYLYDKPSVLIGRKGTIDEPQYMDSPFWTIDTLYYTDVYPDNDPKYLFYVFQTIPWKKYNEATGVPSLAGSTIGKINISLPVSKKEQSKIAEVLSTVDDAIDKTRALIGKYRNLKTGLMQDLLTHGMDENGVIRSFETHEYKDSALGKIPVEWCVQPLSNLTEKIADRDHTTPNYVRHGVYIVSPKDFDEFERIDFSKSAQISYQDHLINRKKTDIRPGDLIFTRIGVGLGKVCYVTEDMPEFSILHSAAMVRVNSGISAILLMYIIRSHYFQMQILNGIQSIGVPDLGMDKINSLLVKYPINKLEQDRISERLAAAEKKVQTERDYLDKLQNIKRGLMQDLLTNTVSVDALL